VSNSNAFQQTSEDGSLVNVEYIVRPGDTLYKIAQKHGVSVDELMNANALPSSLIHPNQVIVIPQKGQYGAVYFEEYIIQPNDTLEIIANNVGSSVTNIAKYNDIAKLLLMENQVLSIPRRYGRYTVQPGDTIESILMTTNMTPMELLVANRNEWLLPGKTINVRKKSSI